MGANGAANADTSHLPEGWQDWPTMREAAALIGMTAAKLSSYVKTGAIKKYAAPNAKGSKLGSYRFDPEDLERLEDALADDEEAATVPTTADTVRAANDGMKQAQAHAARLVTLFETPFNQVLKTLQEENAALRADNAKLREERQSIEALREEVRSTKAVEAIAMAQLDSERKTKDEAITLAKPVVQHFINAALLKGGIDPKMVALKDAVANIPRETLAALFAAELLPADVIEKLKFGLSWEATPEVKP